VSGELAILRSHRPERDRKKVIEVLGHSSIKLTGKNKVEGGLLDLMQALDED
jgi:hypothetical protein